MKTTWHDNIGIGVMQIDNDHQYLMQIFEQIQEHQFDDVKSESIAMIMDQLREFASSHFHHEEEYMLKIGFPGYPAHKEQHKHFKEKTAALCVDVMNHKETAPRDIYNYLSDWVANHLRNSDKKIQIFMEAKKTHEETT